MKMKSLVVIMMLLSGCSGAGHYGRTTNTGGLETNCGGMCSEYKSDGSGCAKFQDDTSNSCAKYFEKVCAASPASCKND